MQKIRPALSSPGFFIVSPSRSPGPEKLSSDLPSCRRPSKQRGDLHHGDTIVQEPLGKLLGLVLHGLSDLTFPIYNLLFDILFALDPALHELFDDDQRLRIDV